MTRKNTALLLNALVLPGLGQLYLGRKALGLAIIMAVNAILLVALFVLLKGLSPVIASSIAGGKAGITAADISQALRGASGPGRMVLAAFFLVWTCALADIFRHAGKG